MWCYHLPNQQFDPEDSRILVETNLQPMNGRVCVDWRDGPYCTWWLSIFRRDPWRTTSCIWFLRMIVGHAEIQRDINGITLEHIKIGPLYNGFNTIIFSETHVRLIWLKLAGSVLPETCETLCRGWQPALFVRNGHGRQCTHQALTLRVSFT